MNMVLLELSKAVLNHARRTMFDPTIAETLDKWYKSKDQVWVQEAPMLIDPGERRDDSTS